MDVIPESGSVFGWGNNEYDQLSISGDSDTQISQPRHLPMPAEVGKVVKVAAGGTMCAVLNGELLSLLLLSTSLNPASFIHSHALSLCVSVYLPIFPHVSESVPLSLPQSQFLTVSPPFSLSLNLSLSLPPSLAIFLCNLIFHEIFKCLNYTE